MMRASVTGVVGAGLGAGLLYLGDVRYGRRRRAMLQDKASHYARLYGDSAERGMRDLLQRSRGMYLRRKARHAGEPVGDATLEARIRSVLGRVTTHPAAIEVYATDGTVELHGALLRAEHAWLLSQVRKVPGVVEVVDRLDLHANAGNHPALQGGGRMVGHRIGFLQSRWPPGDRWLVGIGGLAGIFYGLWRRDWPGFFVAKASALLAFRAISNLELKQILTLRFSPQQG